MSDQIPNVRLSGTEGVAGQPTVCASPDAVVQNASQATAAKDLAGDDRAWANLASSYAHPSDVLRDPKLSAEQKRNLLRQWALDAYRIELSATEGMPSSASSQLNEAIDALIDLDGGTASLSKLPSVRSAKPGARAQAA
ncbi:hypothetical protein MTR72_02950 [Bradyrhizobium sp. ISRA442]|uniref:hypothetical protein n=1 Tax=Bradyrhizobium sp. ISRA442 TaxID=2866197 RepID=UPI00311B137A